MCVQYFPGRPFRLPYERPQLLAAFWPPRFAARALGVPYREIRPFMLKHPELCAFVRVRRGDGRISWIYCVNVSEIAQRAEGL